ncbi:MAG: tetratricopeptide repeat protein, partial [Armatimonadetes bacterium]|nr:tetratricopeptide repeat protein [Armatimonadota bacterium]
SGNLAGKVATLHQLGILAQRRGNYDEAERFIKDGITIAEKLQSKTLQASGLWALGQLRKGQGRMEEAKKLLQQALSIFEQIGDARADDVRKELRDLHGT